MAEWDDALANPVADHGPAPERLPRPDAEGVHAGTVGERGDFVLRCTAVRSLGVRDYPGGRSAEMFVITFEDVATGATCVWFTSESSKFGPEPPHTYRVRATVKEHGEYRGVRQTILSRCTGEEHES